MPRRAELRTISNEGRVKIPAEYMRLHNINGGETVEITCNTSGISIRKYREEHICAVTGQFSKNGEVIGNVFISNEGLKLIQDRLNKKE